MRVDELKSKNLTSYKNEKKHLGTEYISHVTIDSVVFSVFKRLLKA